MLYIKNSISKIYKNRAFRINLLYLVMACVYTLVINYTVSFKTANPLKNFFISTIYAVVMIIVIAPVISYFARSNLFKFMKMNREKDALLNKMRLCFEKAPTGIVVMDSNYIIQDWNPEAERIFGFSENEVAGKKSFKQIMPVDARTHLEKFIDEIRIGNDSSVVCDKFDLKTGNWITCDWSFTSLYNENKRYVGIMTVISDLTNILKTEISAGIEASYTAVETPELAFEMNIFNMDGTKFESDFDETKYREQSEIKL
jgi:PAS domain S-box-containing protein